MSAGGARRGRRDNGIDATDYAVAGDVDPRVGEHLLDVLAAAGIAAYLQPSADLDPVTRTTTVPPRLTDRLYVDRAHLVTAREYLTQLTDEATTDEPAAPAEPDIDAEWARIVAGYHAEPGLDNRPWPAAEDLDPDPESDGTDSVRTQSRPAPDEIAGPAPDPHRLPSAADFSGISVGHHPDEPSLLDGLDTFGADLPDDPDEGYTPPPPPPLPRLSKYAVAALCAIAFGLVLFLSPEMLPIDPALTIVLGFTGILSGFATLIWRLRPGDEEDDDPDDGAVV